MPKRGNRVLACVAAATAAVGSGVVVATAGSAPPPRPIGLTPVGTYDTGLADGSGSVTAGETAALSKGRMYVTNSTGSTLDVVDVSDPAAPALLRRVPLPGGPNSVDVHGDLVAVAVEASPKTDPGAVVFMNRAGDILATVPVGALPDMLTFTDDGRFVLVANEGEPSGYNGQGVDPVGSVSIVSTTIGSPHVRTVGFADFNAGGPRHSELPEGLRLNGPGASVAQDLEPEYIALDEDGRTATVTLQEASALARIDLDTARVTSIRALGWKDHSVPGNGLDASDQDGRVNIRSWPVRGWYMPDAIAAFRVSGQDLLITANEGDSRADWPGFTDEGRLRGNSTNATLAIPGHDSATLRDNANLGRLNISLTDGVDAGGVRRAIYTFGGRSASIWTTSGRQMWDSGDAIERTIVADLGPLAGTYFNVSNSDNTFDGRSDNKGPEPEGVAVGKVSGRTYAFVGLERQGGVVTFDVTRPDAPSLISWTNRRDYTSAEPGPDSGPEVIHFVPRGDSPSNTPMVLVANEVSGTVTLYRVD
ncbi:MAG TPA: choice-of-anchor I family protein [Miltoncostaeaceae bacterium]|nr:choice-of-anchor I family protein [Miltoncostaeaceae bacterium]